jgi:Flp pilus assembly protein TadD
MDLPREPEAADPEPADTEPAGGTRLRNEARSPGETPDGDRESAYELLRRGHALSRRRHHAQAAVVLERAAALEPRKGSILEPLGRACYQSGQPERAREVFEELLEVDPSSHYAHFALGQSLKRLGRFDEARTHLRLASALHPTNQVYAAALRRLPPSTRPAT